MIFRCFLRAKTTENSKKPSLVFIKQPHIHDIYIHYYTGIILYWMILIELLSFIIFIQVVIHVTLTFLTITVDTDTEHQYQTNIFHAKMLQVLSVTDPSYRITDDLCYKGATLRSSL